MKVQILPPKNDYEWVSECKHCGKFTRYSEMTIAEYKAVKLADSVCDECREKLSFRKADSANATTAQTSEPPEKSAAPK